MKFSIEKNSLDLKNDAFIIPIYKGALTTSEILQTIDSHLDGLITQKNKQNTLPLKSDQVTVIHGFNKLKNKLVLLVGVNKADYTSKDIKNAAGTVVRSLINEKMARAEWIHESQHTSNLTDDDIVKSIVIGATAGSYHFDTFKSNKTSNPIKTFTLSNIDNSKQNLVALSTGKIMGDALNTARDLANTPANLLTPNHVIEFAKKAFTNTDVSCEVLSEKKAATLGMNAFLAVAKGSENPGSILIMSYTPSKSKKPTPPLCLVGKGVTFDSGGISIKPSSGMEKMKADMSGAAAVISTMIALSKHKPSFPVVALTPLAENMPSGRAVKPGDVVTAFNGKSIEIINTDAEGRLILGDTLAYAIKTYKPSQIIDIATLTGACSVALGDSASAILGNNEELIAAFKAVSQKTGERVWQLPLYDEHLDALKSDVADIANVSQERKAGTSIAAKFLEQFVSATPWLHIDCASVMSTSKTSGYKVQGMSAEGTLNLIQYCMDAHS